MIHTVTVTAGPSPTGLAEGSVLSHTKVKGTARRLQGNIQQAKLTPSGKEIALLVLYSEFNEIIQQKPERLVLHFFDPVKECTDFNAAFHMNAGSGGVLPQRIVHPLPDLLEATNPKQPLHRPSFSLSPVMDSTGSDYAYILDFRAIFIYSVLTGEQLRKIDPLVTFGNSHQIVDILSSPDNTFLTILTPVNKNLSVLRIEVPYDDEAVGHSGVSGTENEGMEDKNRVDGKDITSESAIIGYVVPGPGLRLKRLASLSPRWHKLNREHRAGTRENIIWDYEQGISEVAFETLHNIIENINVNSQGKNENNSTQHATDIPIRESEGHDTFVLSNEADIKMPAYGTVEPTHWPTNEEEENDLGSTKNHNADSS